MNHQQPKQPFFFLKPPSAILFPGEGPIRRPKGVILHYEVELGLLIGKRVNSLDGFDKASALGVIDSTPYLLNLQSRWLKPSQDMKIHGDVTDLCTEYFLAIDMTARNVQDEARRKGLPWDIAKGFDTFLPLSLPISTERVTNPHDARLWLSVNGQLRQNDNTNLMLHNIPEQLSKISSVMTLEPGDIVLTGTPKGVGSVKPGDIVTAGLIVEDKPIDEASLEFSVEDSQGRYIYSET